MATSAPSSEPETCPRTAVVVEHREKAASQVPLLSRRDPRIWSPPGRAADRTAICAAAERPQPTHVDLRRNMRVGRDALLDHAVRIYRERSLGLASDDTAPVQPCRHRRGSWRGRSSLRSKLRRHLDSLGCCLLKRMSFQVDLGERRRFGRADCASKCLVVAGFQVVNGQEIDPVASGARYPRHSRNWMSFSLPSARAWHGHEVVDLAVGRLALHYAEENPNEVVVSR